MKAFSSILILLFAIFSLCLAEQRPDRFPDQNAVDKDNYEAVTLAAAQKGVRLEPGKRYAFREKWAPVYGEYRCLPDYSHVRLIVGQFFNNPTRSGRQAFSGKAFEMISDEAETKLGQTPVGGTVESQVTEKWWANHYFNYKKKEWVHVSKDNKYEYLGETTATDAYIENQGLKYARDHPSYNIVWNNCMVYTNEVWIGSYLTFTDAQPSRWRIDRKLAENEDLGTESDVKERMMPSEARGIFVCSNIDVPAQENVAKVRMQYVYCLMVNGSDLLSKSTRIPYFNTAFKSREARARQADPEMRAASQREVSALDYLTKAGCSSTPKLFAWKHETQGNDDWVPGGYIDYILMEKLPGETPGYWSGRMSRAERDQLRESFKKAWIECVSHGRVHEDCGIRNLVLDREKQKCWLIDTPCTNSYIVDWEEWRESTDKDVWQNTEYISWNLA
ncbi:hypothetical protein CNMCM7927_001299 [Aspergillus lentulus]|nr:hypothetical protein CNMCM7927_001299 [Aspergillus lentulus]